MTDRTIDENELHLQTIISEPLVVVTNLPNSFNTNYSQILLVAQDSIRANITPPMKADFQLKGNSHQLTERLNRLVIEAAERERFR